MNHRTRPATSPDEARHFKIKTRLEVARLALWAFCHNAWEAFRTLTH
ncbi:hypothetical protein [Actinomadura sp. WMMB 499]|nr:hypothetical protein [Actinomadura sp. WMMB 499]